MKKIALILSVLVIASLSVNLIACNQKLGPKDIDQFYNSLYDAESLEFGMELSAPEVNFEIKMMCDSNSTYNYERSATVGGPTIENTYYTTYIDDYLYTYTQNDDGSWHSDGGYYYPQSSQETETAVDEIPYLKDILNGKNYEYSDDYEMFLAKSDMTIVSDGMEMVLRNVELELVDGNCTVRCQTYMDSYSVDMEIYIKNVNSTEVVLPEI